MLSVGDIVCVTAERPDGLPEICKTKGDIGIIKTIDNGEYEVVTRRDGKDGFWYTERQLRPATHEEIAQELRRVLP